MKLQNILRNVRLEHMPFYINPQIKCIHCRSNIIGHWHYSGEECVGFHNVENPFSFKPEIIKNE